MINNPFKILGTFSKEDVRFFNGRETEVNKLYEIVNCGNIALVFGESGVGKTSLVKCGLAKKFEESDWIDIWVRKGVHIVDSLKNSLKERLSENTRIQLEKNNGEVEITQLIKEVYLDHFKQVYLIFEEFEDLFALGSGEEREYFYNEIQKIIDKKANCKIIFILKEEFYGKLHELEKKIPILSNWGVKVSPMQKEVAKDVVKKYIVESGIETEPGVDVISERIISLYFNSDKADNLLYLQFFLHKLWEKARQRNEKQIKFDLDLIEEAEEVDNALENYLIECVRETDSENEIAIWAFLQEFITSAGTKRPVKLSEVSATEVEKVKLWLEKLKNKKIIIELSNGDFELIHQSLVPFIFNKQPKKAKERLLTPSIHGNPYKGLSAYDSGDCNLFFGRKRVITELLKKIKNERLIAIVGPSGVGKSSLVKAGLVPHFKSKGFHIIFIKPEDIISSTVTNRNSELRNSIEALKGEIYHENHSKVLLYIDQFEQLSTRYEDPKLREQFIELVNGAVNDESLNTTKEVKVILSVRSDYEFEFDLSFNKWRKGKFNVPNFLDDELREVITDPAYYAGLEFSPRYLVDIIIRDAQQSNGTLPLLSYTLNRMYEVYSSKGEKNNLLTEDIFNQVGGIIGGLQSRANKIYDGYPENDPHRTTIRNVILRMVTGTGERAAKKVSEEELIFSSEEENNRVDKILEQFIQSSLIVTGKGINDQAYYEPAHDSLVRNWDKVSNWIAEKTGKDFFYYSPILKEALKGRNVNKLWDDDPRLKVLQNILHSEDNWLNKQETEFVLASSQKRKKGQIKKIAIGTFCTLLLISFFGFSYRLKEEKKEALAAAVKRVEKKEKEIMSKHNIELQLQKDSVKAANKHLLALSDTLKLQYKSSQENLKKNEKLTKQLARRNSLLDDAVAAYARQKGLLEKQKLLVEKQNYELRLEKVTNDLLKEDFAKSPFFDSPLVKKCIDTLMKIKFEENNSDRYDKLKAALNKVSEAFNKGKNNPNKILPLVKKAYESFPHSIIDSIGLANANNNLFYTSKADLTYKLGSRIYLTTFSSDRSHFAFATLNGIKTGIIKDGNIVMDETLAGYSNTQRNSISSNRDYRLGRLVSLSYSNNNNLIAVTSDRKLYKWEKANRPPAVKMIPKSENDGAPVLSVISPDGKKMISDYNNTSIKILNLENLEEDIWKNAVNPALGIISDLVYSPDGKKVLATTESYRCLILDMDKRTSLHLPDTAVFIANFTPDGKNIIYAGKDSIYITDLEGRKIGNKGFKGTSYSRWNLPLKLSLSDDWMSMIVQNGFDQNKYFQRLNKKGQHDSLFYFKEKDEKDPAGNIKIYADGSFGFLEDNSILSYTRPTYIDSVYHFSISLLKKYSNNSSLANVYTAFEPFLTEKDRKELGLTPLSESEMYERALRYYDLSDDNDLNSVSRKDNLLKAKALFNNLLSVKKDNEDYLYNLKAIDTRLFSLDSNFNVYSNDIKNHIAIENNILLNLSNDTGSYKYKYYKGALSTDYGNLSFYSLFVDKPDFANVIETAQQGLSLDSTNDFIYTNLALGYLLTRNYVKARDIYRRLKKVHSQVLNKSFRDAFLEDIALLEYRNKISGTDKDIYEFTQKLKCWLRDECELP